MAIIRLTVDGDKRIRIEPVGEISPDDWGVVLSWWTPGVSVNNAHPYLSVLTTDFIQRMNWLRDNWTHLGHQVHVSDEVKVVARLSENIKSDFERLSGLTERETDADPGLLGLPVRRYQILRAL